jgi:tetrahydromethanopterin S-methyltransferase subunit G
MVLSWAAGPGFAQVDSADIIPDTLAVAEEPDMDTAGTISPALRMDSSSVMPAKGLSGKIQQYRDRTEFNYATARPEGMSLWERFWRWFWHTWSQLMSRDGFRVGFKVLLYGLSIGILLYVMLRLLGMEKANLWMRGQRKGSGIRGEMVEDIHAIDYAQSIADAEAEGRYRDAIRFRFLLGLKMMADRGIIGWNRNKTNVDYARELSSHPLSGPFAQVRRIYEYAWYGEFEVSEADYQALQPYFSVFNRQVTA